MHSPSRLRRLPRPTIRPRLQVSPPTTARPGTAYSFTPTASDPDGDKLTFSVSNRPAWLTFNSATGTLTGTPSAANVGTYSNIVISVSDGMVSAALPAFSIKVTAALAISGTPPTSVMAGTGYSFQPKTNAPSGTKLTFAVQNAPTWASFSSSTGTLSGTPSTSQVGTYSNIVIRSAMAPRPARCPPFPSRSPRRLRSPAARRRRSPQALPIRSSRPRTPRARPP